MGAIHNLSAQNFSVRKIFRSVCCLINDCKITLDFNFKRTEKSRRSIEKYFNLEHLVNHLELPPDKDYFNSHLHYKFKIQIKINLIKIIKINNLVVYSQTCRQRIKEDYLVYWMCYWWSSTLGSNMFRSQSMDWACERYVSNIQLGSSKFFVSFSCSNR